MSAMLLPRGEKSRRKIDRSSTPPVSRLKFAPLLALDDTSKQAYFKPSTSQKYLDIIVKIINDAIEAIPT